jgi:kynurenine/2-aminoadipate aminotransferase
MSSGLRVGFVTGPKALIERLVLHVMVSSLHTSGLSQVMMSDLLHTWGLEGFKKHTDSVVEFYRKQKDAMMASADKWLTGLAEWSEPSAGMFVWLKLNGIADTKALIEDKAQKKEVLLVPGCFFMTDSSLPCQYVRACFSISTPDRIDTGLQRLAEVIREELDTSNNNQQ